jgi:hypothetical protein
LKEDISVSNSLTFSVGLHPFFKTLEDLRPYVSNFPNWNKRLTLLYRLKVVIAHFDSHVKSIPQLDPRLKTLAWWWDSQIDDKYLLVTTSILSNIFLSLTRYKSIYSFIRSFICYSWKSSLHLNMDMVDTN